MDDNSKKEERVKVEKNRFRKTRSYLYIGLGLFIAIMGAIWLWDVWNKVPSNIHLKAGIEQGLEFCVPATATIYKNEGQEQVSVDLNQELKIYGNAQDTYTMQVDLFGFIPFKQSEVSVIQEKRVTPLGYSVGIYVQADGILIIDTGEFIDKNGKKVSPVKNILKSGDYISKINQKQIISKQELIDEIANCSGKSINLEVRRKEECFSVQVNPIQDKTGEYKLGIWVRDNAQGIGTITFVDENGHFGALGHGINDVDTTNLMEIEKGALYKADIISITKGSRGNPGELAGVIAYAKNFKVGEIYENSPKGVYGVLEKERIPTDRKEMSIALKQEIYEGNAQILCSLTGEAKFYEVEITDIHLENDNINRGLEIKVTDEELLQTTGGIIQGMSGSPIIQNGKLIGAVTHVLVNDPTRGYGIFIENMLEAVE